MRRRFALALALTALAAAVGLAEAADRRIRITNSTAATMVSLQASGVEVLGSPLPAGKGTIVTVDDGDGTCVVDFVATMDDGSTRTAPGVNVCDLSVYAIR